MHDGDTGTGYPGKLWFKAGLDGAFEKPDLVKDAPVHGRWVGLDDL